MRILSLLIFLPLIFASFTLAESTVNCHCFQDRTYDPQRAHAADPYFLATTQNALLASVFGLSKKDVVRAKMGGVDGDSLWVGHYLAQQSTKSFAEIEALFSEKKNWQEVIQHLRIVPERLDPRFVAALNDQKKLAMAVVDEQLAAHLDLAPLQLRQLREQGADNHQTIMVMFLVQSSLLEATELLAKVTEGKTSWGRLLAEQGLFNGSDIEAKWYQLFEENREK